MPPNFLYVPNPLRRVERQRHRQEPRTLQVTLQHAENRISPLNIKRAAAGVEPPLDPAIDGRMRASEQAGEIGNPQIALFEDNLQALRERFFQNGHLNIASRSKPAGGA